MKVLIVYSSGKGFIREAAERLQKSLGDGAVLCDLKERKEKPDAFDFVVLGGAFHAGKLPGKLLTYMKQNEANLKEKRTAFLLGGADEKHYGETFKKNVAPAFSGMKIFFVGGRYLPEQHGWIIRKIMAKISGNDGPLHNEKWEALDELIKYL